MNLVDQLRVLSTHVDGPKGRVPPEVSIKNQLNKPLASTSPEAYEGFCAVWAILRGQVGVKKIVLKDAQNHCAILLDDSHGKQLCSLQFNHAQKLHLGIFNASKEEELFQLDSVDEIFKFSDQLKATLALHLREQ